MTFTGVLQVVRNMNNVTPITKINPQNSILLLGELLGMDRFSKKTIGFCEIMKVDANTFTISEVNNDDFLGMVGKSGLIDEVVIKEVQNTSH